MTAKEIKQKLKEILEKEPENTDEILALTTKLATLDNDKVRFSIDAGVIDRLGKELVARHETAVSELIKNAYDADATSVKLTFESVDDTGGTLTIVDNGTGMTRNDLVNGFMRISSTDKIHNPISKIYGRKRAGKKGIGRFATQRLGDNLTIITQTQTSKTGYKITIDWTKYKSDEELLLITNKIEEIPRDLSSATGTTLIIKNLEEWWSEATIRRVYRYALDIVQPFPLSKQKIINGKRNDPGFKIECYRDKTSIADEESMFYDHALAEIEGYVDKDGYGFWEIKKSKVDTVTSQPQLIKSKNKTLEGKFKYLDTIHFKAYYFIFSKKLLPKQVESYIRETARDYGGIRIYRNGFRVLPYAEPQDDWLGLDASIRKRSILPVHGNINFFGFVEIAGNNKNFIELSSREGLFQNDAYKELVDYLYKSLIAVVSRIAEARGRKTTTGQKNWKKEDKKPEDVINEAADDLDAIADDLDANQDSEKQSSNDSSSDEKTKTNQEKANEYRAKAKRLRLANQVIKEKISELAMLRVLAGLGLIIGEFTHEITTYLSVFNVDAQYLVDNLLKSSTEYERAVRLKKTFNSFQIYASYFDETISKNANRDLKIINLKTTVKEFKKTIKNDLIRNNIEMDIELLNDEIYTLKMHESEWASILFNFYSNSKKALKRENPPQRKIKIISGIQEGNVFLQFLDNGNGIPKEARDKVFNAFFSTSTPKGHSATLKDEMSGTGLGLKIVKDTIDGYNGDIFLDNPVDGYKTSFRIELPKATEEEIDELWDIE